MTMTVVTIYEKQKRASSKLKKPMMYQRASSFVYMEQKTYLFR